MGVLTKKEKEKLFLNIDNKEIIEKEVAFSWDGKNLILRFPKDIAEYLGVNKENRFTKNVKFKVEEVEGGGAKKEFEIVERTKPKREIKSKEQNGKKEKKNTKDN